MASNTAEEAVREYLRYVRNPDAMRGDTAELDARIEAADDPLERLQLHAERARTSDPEPRLRDAFVLHVKAYADERGIPAEAFRAEGVDAAVLREAGLLDGRGRRRERQATTERRPRVTAEQVRQALPGKNKTFTLREVADRSGASVGTVRKVVAELLESGHLTDEGPEPSTSRPGRTPTRFRVTKKIT